MDPLAALEAGTHPETAAYRLLLAHAGLAGPDGAPPSEALVLGVGGGLGMGYILWEFQQPVRRILVLGMRNRWQYPLSLTDKLAERLGVRWAMAETGGARGAQAALQSTLALGRPAMLWVDQAHLPWLHLPAMLDGCLGHTVVAVGRDGADWLIADRGEQPWRLGDDELAAARGRIGSYKNRLLSVDALGAVDWPAAVRAGLADCAEHLAGPSDSFGLPAIRKWARTLTAARGAKAWPVLFADRAGLLGVLVSIFQSVSDYGTMGGSLRRLYADFLHEAAAVVEQPALRAVGEQYRQLGVLWGELGEMALPTQTPALAQAKALLAQRSALAIQGAAATPLLAPLDAAFDALAETAEAAFPLDAAETNALFATLAAQLEQIFAAEQAANAALRAALAA